MKIKVGQAVFATLDLVMEMSAKQNVFNRFLVYSLSESDEEAARLLKELNAEADSQLKVVRAKLLQYSEIDIEDLLRDGFDF